ncbi:MAG: hypothetical protein COW92_00430 [Candidatus Omnitrophica bacterium CG22_combo_CG10-13_8_21_14_all_43_16]|nr:MAG: hypothetical protein COW92_00430 [Candidatus Omnitrophica bacterium CG22_combo_CG10-13_8_21_14_all_43_16]
MKRYVNILVLITIILAAVIPYLNSIHNPFIWDEEVMIAGNPIIKDWKYLPDVFKTSIFGGPIGSSGFYRPVYALSFMLDYSIWQLNTIGYHLFNIFLHVLNGILLYFLIVKLCLRRNIAWLASLLFVLFPINCHVVALVAGRIELILGFLSLLYILSFLNGIERSKAYFLASAFLFISSLFTKESALMLPFIMLAYVFVFLEKEKRRKTMLPLAVLMAILFAYPVLRYFLLGSPLRGTLSLINEASFLERVYTLPRILLTYIQLIVAPISLKSEYNFVVHAFRDPYVWMGVPGLAAIFFLILKFLKPTKHAIFFSCWFLIGLAPYSNLGVPLHATLIEHWGYFSSMGFAVLMSMAIFKIVEKISRRQKYVFAAIIVSLAIFYAAKIVERNKEWGDPFVLYKRDSEKEPASFLLHCNLGVEYFRRGMLEDAKKEFILSNKVCPGAGYDIAYNNLGVIYAREGRIQEAVSYYRQSIVLNNYALAYANLGGLYNNLKMHKDAITVLGDGAARYPLNIEILYQLGVAYYEDGQPGPAKQAFQRVENIQKDYSKTKMFLDMITDKH